MLKRVVVVGGSLAGLRAVETLRAEGYDGTIEWVGEEPHLPYDRTPLSKQFLYGDLPEDRLPLRKAPYADLGVHLHLGVRARSLDVSRRVLALDDGGELGFEGLILATGAVARRLPASGSLAGVFQLRTLDDARAIRAALAAQPRVAIVGAGFIGSEVAAACRQIGLSVVLIESAATPCARELGPVVGERIAALHRSEGVDLRTGVAVAALEGARRVERLKLTDGSLIEADLVIVGIGAAPATDWLEGSGLELDDGIVCDATGSTRVPSILAAGDCARAYHPLYGRHVRVEHWAHAGDQGVVAARTLVHGEGSLPLRSVPLAWSDAYDVKIQFAGVIEARDTLHVIDGALDGPRFAAAYLRGRKLVGAVTWNHPRRLIQLRQWIARGGSVEELPD